METKIVEKYRDHIKQELDIDDFTIDMIEGEIRRKTGSLSLIERYPFFFHGLLSIISNLVFFFKGMKRNVKFQDENFIFISCPDPAFRTRTIGLISGGMKYFIIYLPNFHIPTALSYHKYFKQKGIRTFFPTIKFVHVLRARKKIRKVFAIFDKQDVGIEHQMTYNVLSSFEMYNEVVKDYMQGSTNFNGKWILEHQKFYFMASVANLHMRGIPSTMLQHGVFFKPVYDFIPLLCDKVLCCSNREKAIYLENGTAADRVEVFGAPLQTLQYTKDSKEKAPHYEMLIMMTLINDQNVELIKNVLNYIKDNYSGVIVRMRPRSRKNDERILGETLRGMKLSKEGTPIAEDIIASKKVISFSLDANIELAKFHKPFVYIWDGDEKEISNELGCATEKNYQEEIRKLMSQDFYSTFSEDQYEEILGDTNVEVLQNKFYSYIHR